MHEIQKTIQDRMLDIPQPAGSIVADWYKANEPTPYELLVLLSQALAGKLTLEDLELETLK